MIFIFLSILLFTQINLTLSEINVKEIVLIYIGSSQCSFCNSEENKSHFRSIKNKIKNKQDFKFKSIGISLDSSTKNGFIFLNELDDFDEVIIADRIKNSAYFKYVLNEYKGIEIIPQIVIILRTYNDVSDDKAVEIDNEELLYRIVGTDKMELFASLVEEIDFNKFY